MDGWAWEAAVHGVAKSWTRLSYFTFILHFHALEKEMAIHSSVLAWRIPGTGEPGGLPSMGSHRVGHDWSDLAAAAAAIQLKWEDTESSTTPSLNSLWSWWAFVTSREIQISSRLITILDLKKYHECPFWPRSLALGYLWVPSGSHVDPNPQ